MSVQSSIKRKTAPDIRARKGKEPIVVLTSYHAHTAVMVDLPFGSYEASTSTLVRFPGRSMSTA